MADTTYINQAVYMKQGGDEQVIADGGLTTVESGGKITAESGGEFEGQSGASFDFQSGFKFFATNQINAEVVHNALLSLTTVTRHSCSTGTSTISGVSAIAPAYGTHILTAATAVSLGSWDLPIPSAGKILWINMENFVGDANASILASEGGGGTGVVLMMYGGLSASSLEASASAMIKLVCATDGVWEIAEASASVTIRPST